MQNLEERTFQFAIRVAKFVSRFWKPGLGQVIGYQLLKSGTSIGANWEEATAASSNADFVYRVEVCERESRESNYWIRLAHATVSAKDPDAAPLTQESKDLVAIFTSIGRKGKRRG